MTAFWLSLVLAFAGCAGLLLAGRGMWQGWAVGLAVQPLWLLFAVATKGYGLLLTAFMYAFVYGRNLRRALHPREIDPEDELAVAQQVAAFYRKMAGRLARENEHYKSLAAVRGAEQDRTDFDDALDVLAA